MTYPITKAAASDLGIVLHILVSCADWLSQNGMNHWERAHTEERVTKRLQNNDVYLINETGNPVGTITLSRGPPFYYKDSDKKFWKEPDALAIYISGLAVLPSHHGRGFASDLLSFAERRANEKDIHYIRFDAVIHYKKLTQFYLNRGYRIVGKRKTGTVESNFFEKEL